MKREWIAAALLLLVLGGSLWNISYLDGLTDRVELQLSEARAQADAGNFAEAETTVAAALDLWLGAEGYLHIFIRHPEIDSTADAFYELSGVLAEQNAEGIPSAFEKLLYHLDSIDTMDHLRLGSIL